jgi:hypothetical protein
MAALKKDRTVKYILIAAVIINFLVVLPLMGGFCLLTGDGFAHYSAIQAASVRTEAGAGFFGSWFSEWAMGFPSYVYYQYLAHFLVLLANIATFKLVSVLAAYKLLVILAFSFLPLSIYYGLTRLKLARLPSALASLFSFALSSSVGFGDLGPSLVYHGLFTQLIGMLLFPIALARVYVSVSDRRSYFPSVLLASILFLTHPMSGYALCLACIAFLFVKENGGSVRPILLRVGVLAVIFALAFVVVSHFYIPFFVGSGHYGSAFYATSGDYYQSSAGTVLLDFITGKSLDYYRFPFILLTVFFFLGLYISVRDRKSNPHTGIYLAGLVLFLLISFGGSFWGSLFSVIPGMRYLIFHRLVFALQFFALFFVGMAIAYLFEALQRRLPKGKQWFVYAVLLLILIPLVVQSVLAGSSICSAFSKEFDSGNFGRMTLFMRGEPDGRFIARPELGFSAPHIESLLPIYTGHDSFSTSSIGSVDSISYYYTQYFRLHDRDAYDLFNVRYAIVPSDREVKDGFYKHAFSAGNYSLYRINTSGFFGLGDSTVAVAYDSSPVSDFVRSANKVWMASSALDNNNLMTIVPNSAKMDRGDFGRVIYENQPLDEPALKRYFDSLKPRTDCGIIGGENRSIAHYAASVFTNRSCYLYLKVTYNPAWRAFINGGEVNVSMVSPSFMAVKLPEGMSIVEFIYRPDNTSGYWLLFFGILILAGLLMYDTGVHRRIMH